MNQDLMTCKCSSLEHIMIITYDEEDVFVSIHLKTLPFFKRIWAAIKYVFGFKCSYGNFEEIILSKSSIPQLKEIIEFLETD